MRDSGFLLKYLILVVVQILLWNYFNFTQLLMLTILPVMVLCIPVRYGTVYSMCIAFATGFAVDFLAGGMLGLTSLALVPVALLRVPILQLVFGEELFSRGDNISVHKLGAGKMLTAIMLSTLIFLVIYVWADGAGTRPFWFNALKVVISHMTSSLLSLFVAGILCPDSNQRWT